MVYFALGFIAAAFVTMVVASFAREIENGDCNDAFKVYYTKGNEYFSSKLEIPKYGITLGGSMADDIYIWLTKGAKGDNEKDS